MRTYVHLDGTEPGVYFFSLDAASLVATVGARIGLGLPYFWATGRERLGDERDIAYRLRRRAYPGAHCRVRSQVQAYRGPAAPGSLDDFLIERYVLHVQRGPSLWSVRVQHRPYPLYDVQVRDRRDRPRGDLRPAAQWFRHEGARQALTGYCAGSDCLHVPRAAS